MKNSLLESYARFLKRQVNLELVNARSEGYPEGKSRDKFWRFCNSDYRGLTNQGITRQTL